MPEPPRGPSPGSGEDRHLVHGLGHDLVEPDWPPLQLEELERVLARFPAAGGARELLWHSPRPQSAGALVATGGPTVFVKRHHRAVRDLPGLAVEHAFADHLRERGVPTVVPLRTGEGASAVAEGCFAYEVQLAHEGLDLYRDAPSWTPFEHPGHARSAGVALARLHLAAEGFTFPERPDRLLVSRSSVLEHPDLVEAVGSLAAERPGLAAALAGRPWQEELGAVLVPLHHRLLPFLGELGSRWGHNDWHASNLLWSTPGPEAEVVGVLDLGLADRTSPAYDLATAIERNAVAWLDLPGGGRIAHPELAGALLEGYQSVRPLAVGEAAALPELLPLVHLGLALGELEHFHDLLGSEKSATVAYETFLLGHARWFATSDGSDLLDSLRA